MSKEFEDEPGVVQAEYLTDEEFALMLKLMERYANTDLDQWEAWEVETKHGKVFINMSRKSAAES